MHVFLRGGREESIQMGNERIQLKGHYSGMRCLGSGSGPRGREEPRREGALPSRRGRRARGVPSRSFG